MKKILVRLFLVFVLLIILGVVAVHLFLDDAVKRGILAVGPKITKVEVKLESVSLSLLTGSGKLSGFVIGNPEGYKTPSALSVGSTALAVDARSLLSDKIIIRTIELEAPEVTFETDLKANNLGKIRSNLEETTGGGKSAPATATPSEEAKASKKLQIDNFVFSGGKLHVTVSAFGGKSATVKLPEIRLKDLGTGPEGITAAELTKLVLQKLEEVAAQQATTAIAELSKGAVYLGQDAKAAATNTVEKATKGIGIGDLFKSKK
jgi:uncharacterized protein involved in outer membrane biogenesis